MSEETRGPELESSDGASTVAAGSRRAGASESHDEAATGVIAGSIEPTRSAAATSTRPPDHEPLRATPAMSTAAVDSKERDATPSSLAAPSSIAVPSRLATRVAFAFAVLVAFLLGVLIAGVGGEPVSSDRHDGAADAAVDDPVIWTCSMHPQIRMREPGLCPICGMDLIPAQSGGDGASQAVGPAALSPSARARAQLQVAPVARTEPRAELRLLGRVDYDESSLRAVTAWTGGRIDRLRVRVTGASIKRGQVIATLYSPEVYTATRDLVQALAQADKLSGGLGSSPGLARTALESARERLRLLGVSDAEIARIEREREAPRSVEIRSPFAGTILERMVEEGDYVQPGSALFNVADLSRVWIQIDAYEPDLPHLRVGQEVIVAVESLPGEPLVGKVAFIDPVIDHASRTAKVRIEVDNRGGQLRPGMFAEALIRIDGAESASALVIPSTAPLFTGRRSVVYVEVPGAERPTYELREVRLGARAGPFYPVLAGLSEGERVVTRGAFVLDADLQLAGGQSMMTLADDRSAAAGPALQVTREAREALRPVLATYLEAQVHLAEDHDDEARGDLRRLADIARDLELPGPRALRDAWQGQASALSGGARTAASGREVADLRRGFEGLSDAVIELLEAFGNPLDAPVRVAYCPMALDSKGAAWVQRDEVLQNPYYGAAMLRCGEFRATVLPGELLGGNPAAAAEGDAAPGSVDAHGAHHH